MTARYRLFRMCGFCPLTAWWYATGRLIARWLR
jgi:hypothetical protein